MPEEVVEDEEVPAEGVEAFNEVVVVEVVVRQEEDEVVSEAVSAVVVAVSVVEGVVALEVHEDEGEVVAVVDSGVHSRLCILALYLFRLSISITEIEPRSQR